MTDQVKPLSNVRDGIAIAVAPEGGLRATAGATAIALPPDPGVARATAKRRQFSSSQEQCILADADRCTEPGQIGALLRREGLYSSNLTTWRKQHESAEPIARAPQKRGLKADPARAHARQLAALTHDNERMHRQLAQAYTINVGPPELCTLLGSPTAEELDENC